MCTFARFALPCGEGRYANFSWGGSLVKVFLYLGVCSGLAVAHIFYSSLSFCERLVVACDTVYVC
jgi:hypothetical protein